MAATTLFGVNTRSEDGDYSAFLPVVDRLVVQRHANAVQAVEAIRAAHPNASRDELVARLIRRYTNEMALSGAVTGGAAAAPVAGIAVAAASAGAEATMSVSRLGEMIMAIGHLYGAEEASQDERRAAVLTIMGLADGAAIGISGLAARAGSRGGARLLAKLPTVTVAASAGRTRRLVARATSSRGPWSLAALIPYGIGAGLGAAGSAMLTRAVGRAAKEYFALQAQTEQDGPRERDAVGNRWPHDTTGDVIDTTATEVPGPPHPHPPENPT